MLNNYKFGNFVVQLGNIWDCFASGNVISSNFGQQEMLQCISTCVSYNFVPRWCRLHCHIAYLHQPELSLNKVS